jgi:aminopeptidase
MQTTATGAETLLNVCAGLRGGEKLLIASDHPADQSLEILIQKARNLGGMVTFEKISGPLSREPSADVSGLMLENDVVLFCVNEDRTLLWGHSDAKVAALAKGGRVLFLTQSIDSTPDAGSLEIIQSRSSRMAEILEKSFKVTLLTGDNLRLELKLAGRRALRLSSILQTRGSWGAVPDYAEAAVAPWENGSNGDFRVDGMIVGLGKATTPVDLHFEDGKLTKISDSPLGKKFEKFLEKNDSSSRVLCELGFGTNHLRREVRGEFDDKKALGSVHVAMGDNHTFGGDNRSNIHVDCLAIRPKILIDDRPFDIMNL